MHFTHIFRMFHCNDAISALLDLWSLKNSQELNATIDAVLTVSQLGLELERYLNYLPTAIIFLGKHSN